MFRIRDVLRQTEGTEAPLMSSMDDPADDSGGAMASSVDPETNQPVTVDAAGDQVPEEKPVPDAAATLANAGGAQFDYPPEFSDEYIRAATQAGLSYNPVTRSFEESGAPPSPRAPKRRGGPPAATMEVSGTRSPFMGLLRDETMEAARAIQASADAQAAQDLETANVYDEMAQTLDDSALELRRIQQDAMRHAQESSARLQAQADELGATEPQAGRLFGTGAQAAGFGAALSIAAGAMLSVRAGGPNVALAIVNKAIERDLLAQREAIRNKKDALTAGMSIARQMQAAYQNDITAEKAVQATLQRYAENRLKAIINRTSGPILQAQAQEKIAKLGLEFASTLEQVTRENYQLRVSGPVQRLQGMVATALGQQLPPATDPANVGDGEAAINGATDAAKGLKNGAKVKRGQAAKKAAAGQAAVKSATWQPAPNNPLFLVRTGADGQPEYIPNPTDPLIAQGALNQKYGTAGGVQIPDALAAGIIERGLPQGWIARPMGNGTTRIVPIAGLRPANPEKVSKLDPLKNQFIPVPDGFDIPEPGRDVRTDRTGRKQQGFWANPSRVGGPAEMKRLRKNLNEYTQIWNSWRTLYLPIEELLKKQDQLSTFDLERVVAGDAEAGARMARAAALFTRLNAGGVMGEAEFARAGSTFSDRSQIFRKENVMDLLTNDADALKGWQSVNRIIRSELENLFSQLGSGMGQAASGESADTQTERPK